MEVRLQKWGNSIGIRIPSNILKTLNLKENDIVILKENDDKIIISKSRKQKISLKERFDNYNGENIAKDYKWDAPKGKEIW